jgi:E3 ubiquitin-protein ligase TRIP12
MLDSRIIDLSFNKVFLKHVLGEEVPLTLASLKVSCTIHKKCDEAYCLKLVDMDLANSVAKLQSIAQDSGNIGTDPVSSSPNLKQ